MNKLFKNALITIGATLAIPAASAAVIDFDSLSPDIYAAGDAFSDGNYKFTVGAGPNDTGFAGAIGSNVADACFLIDCPVGNDSQYYLGLNDGSLNIASDVGMGFTLGKFEASFVAPVIANIPFSVARLLISAQDYLGNTYNTSVELPGQNANGFWEFSGFAFDAPGLILKQIAFTACLTDVNGACVPLGENQAQFGLDNLNVSTVPEPASALLIALGLAGMGIAYRRKQAA